MKKFSAEIELRGHLIDSLILTKVFDGIMDHGGSFEVLDIKVGKKKKDESYAKLLVTGKNTKNLDTILNYVYRQGDTSKTQKNAILKTAIKNMVMPDNFYSTTNNPTQIYLNNKWIDVDNMMMDKCIVVKGKKATCIPIRQVKKGDKIVTGENGVKVIPPERPREGMNVFEFMGSGSSSERPTQHIAKKVAEDIRRTKKMVVKLSLLVDLQLFIPAQMNQFHLLFVMGI